MRSAWKSDPGLVRDNNEDTVLADEDNGIYLLADGMGREAGGEVASNLAVMAAYELLVRLLPGHKAPANIGHILAEALAVAHSAVAKRALADPRLKGMGTTLEIVVVRNAEAINCHVGDSRVYLFRRGALRQLTNDDNYAAFLAVTEKIPADQIPTAYRHILTQAVGASEELVPEIRTIRMEPGDLLLVCSDGLTEALSDEEIKTLVGRSCAELATIADALVATANARGGPDNISVVIIEPIPAAAAVHLLLPMLPG